MVASVGQYRVGSGRVVATPSDNSTFVSGGTEYVRTGNLVPNRRKACKMPNTVPICCGNLDRHGLASLRHRFTWAKSFGPMSFRPRSFGPVYLGQIVWAKII